MQREGENAFGYVGADGLEIGHGSGSSVETALPRTRRPWQAQSFRIALTFIKQPLIAALPFSHPARTTLESHWQWSIETMRNFSLAVLLATSVCSPAFAQSASDEARTSREEARAERAEQRAEQAQAAPVQVERAQAAPVFEQRSAEVERVRAPEVRSAPQIEVAERNDDRGRRGDDGERRGWGGRDAAIAAQAQQQQPQPQFSNRNFQGRPDGGFQGRRDESSQTRDDGRFNRGGGQGVFQGTPPLAQNDRRGWGGRGWDGNHNGERHDERRDDHHDDHHNDHRDNRGWNQGNAGQPQVWNRGGDGRWNRGNDGQWNRHDGDRDHNWNNGQRWGDNRNWGNNRGDYRNNNRWDRSWRNDSRYNWQSYRNQYSDRYRSSRYYNPYGYDYNYQRFGIGIYLDSLFFGSRYWLNDPFSYRLPSAPYGYRWVRYYNDVVLVDTRTGYVEDVIYDFFR